ncbi:Transposon Tn3 resolvase [Methylobacterium hispanicum]|jgi:DNA invertase Pin-like site-specific DNA recombinase|uniref:Transposon Tn3 resolvase n=1 Tax=Methylobacterium hispanicum TaxID=270350 RepID=A0AAV4ZYC5_9HYPH|nr:MULTISPECIES: recombinase family protein [Methylobacterium]GJD92594.1 Transposon Tn3 resolvase [Methylobacterium hispanicum]
MTRIGYARVSTADQDHATQVARLKEAGCSIVRTEKASGKTREGRDELADIMSFIRDGDELMVVKLDRLGRSTRDVLNLVHELEGRGAFLSVLEPAFSTKDATGHMLVTVLGMVAEMERKFIRERQQAGIEAIKSGDERERKKKYPGRKPTVKPEVIREMHAAGSGPSAIAKALGISRMSVHRVLNPKAAAEVTEAV